MQRFFFNTLLFGLFSIFAISIQASVNYTDWSEEGISDLIYKAKANEQMVLVNITQPDWCPSCIRLENAIIKNPEETEFSTLASHWVALEVFGYDKEGADFLEAQNLRFYGTPTILLLDPKRINSSVSANSKRLSLNNKKPTLRLGDIRVVHSVAGFPDDFTAQFIQAANGYDLLAEAQKTVREEQSLEAYKALALVYVNQGNAKQAGRVYQSLLFRDDLLDEEVQEIEWDQIYQVSQRVEKDHVTTVNAIDRFIAKYPDFIDDKDRFEEYAYKYAWSLTAIGRVKEAQALLRKAYVEPNEVAGIREYLYFAFRNPSPLLLEDAHKVCIKALDDFPESEAYLQAANGRLLRRQNRLPEARNAFIRAIDGLNPESEGYVEDRESYQGQLQFIEAELEKSGS